MSGIGTVLDDAAKDMAKAGEKAGASIAEHFEGIGKTLEDSGKRYKGAESDIEKSFTGITKDGGQEAEKAAGEIGKNSAKTVASDGKQVADGAEETAAKSVGSEAAEGEKLAAGAGKDAEDAHVPGSQGASKDPVDLVSGEMFLDQRDVVLDGVLVLLLERMHRSGYPHGRLFGRTWASTLDQRIEIDDDGVHYAAPDGTVLHYQVPAQPGQKVLPSAGARWSLCYDQHADVYLLEKPESGQTLHFGGARVPQGGGADGAPVPERRLGAVTDRNGNRITIVHDAQGVPTDVYHSGGYHIEVRTALTREGVRIGEYVLVDPHDRSSTSLARFGYDMAGRLTQAFNSSGLPMCFEYDDADRITAWIDRNGYRYDYRYDPDTGRVVRAVGADGLLSASFVYDSAARETVMTDSTGELSTYRYNARGQVVEAVDALGGVVRTEHDAYDRLLSRTDQLGRTTRIRWSEDGDPIEVTHPDGTTTRAEYSAPRRARRVTAADGGVWQYAYDERGNLTAATDPSGAVSRLEYDEHGGLASVTGRAGEVRRFANDARGLPVASSDALGATTRITRDAFGRPVAVTDPSGCTVTRAWTVEGYPARRELPDGSYEAYAYDAENNLLEFRDLAGFVTRFEYGGFDRVSARTDPGGSRYGFEYDTELRLARVVGPNGLDWRYSYDACGRVVGERDFNGREIGYRLDAAGQMVERSCPGGESVVFRHDASGRVTGRTVGTAEYAYAFDALGSLLRAEGPDGVLEYVRDPLGRVLTETFNGHTSHRAYDATGRQVGRTTSTGAESGWDFDAAGRAVRLAAGVGGLELQRDMAGRETGRILGPDAALSQSFDTLGRLDAQAIWVRDGQSEDGSGYRSVQGRTYVYRADGFPLEVADRLGGDARYELDQLGRVTSVQAATWRESYAYDALGNLAGATVPEPAEPGASPAPADAPVAPEAFELHGTLVRTAGRSHYKHDARGRVVRRTRRTLSGQRREWTYVWDDEDLLREVHTADGATWHYSYDPLGRRVGKQQTGPDGSVATQVAYSWDGPRLAEEATRRPDGSVTVLTWDYEPGSFAPAAQRRRTWVDGASAAQIDEEFFAIVADRAGTARELVTPDGRVVWRQAEGLWGGRIGAAAAEADCPLRFPGQYHDEETGWHYNLHRYYIPETASDASPDPLGLDAASNHHAYIDNPLIQSDPLGLAPADCPSWGDQDPASLAARQQADSLSSLSNKKRPAVSESVEIAPGMSAPGTSTPGRAAATPRPCTPRCSRCSTAFRRPNAVSTTADAGCPGP